MRKRVVIKKSWLSSIVIVVYCFCSWIQLLECTCMPRKGCSTALSVYTVQTGDDLNTLVTRFQTTLPSVLTYNAILDQNTILTGDFLYFPIPCECVDDLLGYSYTYSVQYDDTVNRIADTVFEGLSTPAWINQANRLTPTTLIDQGEQLQVPVNCSCGNPSISASFGLFATYPAISTDNVSSLSTKFSTPPDVIEEFNPSANWSGTLSNGDIVFIPVRVNGIYPPYNFR
ncbi:unnamed protein product [Calypogeia fissa]